jgi:UDP-N-acetylmuramoyl-L-alanyl-D-glutamate--2,6-diaminopimelate ligase
MLLDQLMPGAPPTATGVEVANLSYDTCRVTPGTLFFCVPGFTRDGHDFAADAVAAGAVALVVQRPVDVDVPQIQVPDVREAMADAAARFNGDPTAELCVIGVTGTNGKTTTAFLVRAVLEAQGRACGLLGTVKSVIGGVEHEVVRTTPEAIELQRDFRAMVDAGDVACAMEVSSHALELQRARGIHFAAAIFTNLTQDHLDFHPSMEDYYLAKRRLFTMAPGAAVVNVDDPYGRRLAAELEDPITFSLGGEATYSATDVQTGLRGSWFTARTPDGPVAVRSTLRGRFNVANVLAALAGARAVGVELDTAVEAIASAGQVPGRLEPVPEGQGFEVLVDYAHTPDSLENVLRAARELGAGRVHVVFGCGGDRDRGKRPLMGEIAARLADRVIVTSDNPRSEDPEEIIKEILAGTGGDVRWLADRRAAIAEAITGADDGDVVVIAGKGHEQGQEFAAGVKVPFDDVQISREVLRSQVLSRT